MMAKQNNDPKTETNTNNEQSEAKASTKKAKGDEVVQLRSNQAGHHVGETFKRKEAEELGIIDHCHPFSPNKK